MLFAFPSEKNFNWVVIEIGIIFVQLWIYKHGIKGIRYLLRFFLVAYVTNVAVRQLFLFIRYIYGRAVYVFYSYVHNKYSVGFLNRNYLLL